MLKSKKRLQPVDKLKTIHYWAYGVGHFLNDLTVACWLNFLVFYLDRIV